MEGDAGIMNSDRKSTKDGTEVTVNRWLFCGSALFSSSVHLLGFLEFRTLFKAILLSCWYYTLTSRAWSIISPETLKSLIKKF